MIALTESRANKMENLKDRHEIEDENEHQECEDDDSMESDQEEENDNSSDGDAEDEEDDDGNQTSGNVGWANTFAKVLQQEKPKSKKYLVLSRAKKLNQSEAGGKNDEQPLSFQIEKSEEVKERSTQKRKHEQDESDEKPSKIDLQLSLISQKDRNNKSLDLHVKPSLMNRERERAFKRIATKGVVQLFNALRTQQRDLVNRLEQAGPLDHKRDAVLNNINKRQFLDVLMGGQKAKSENVDHSIKSEKYEDDNDDKPSQWSVLRDDFMTNKKLTSHWEKNDDSDNSDDPAADTDDDSDSS